VFGSKFGLQKTFWFIGRVEDINDPLRQDRVRVRCFGYHEDDESKLPKEGLPWATVMLPTTSAGIHGIGQSGTGLLVGSHVVGIFADGVDAQQLLVIGTLGASLVADYAANGIPTTPGFVNGQNNSSGNQASGEPGTGSVQPDLLAVDVNGVLGPLSQNEVNKLKAAIAQKESRGSYTIVNSIGYLGRYQFGAAALNTVGFVNRSTTSNAALNNDSSWTGRMGVTSKQKYLENGPAQEAAMDALMRVNYQGLVRSGVITNESPPDVVAGYIAVSHNQGVGAAIKLKNGSVTRDGYGTSTTEFYNIGKNAVGTRTAPAAGASS
jgi:hypothetical protein